MHTGVISLLFLCGFFDIMLYVELGEGDRMSKQRILIIGGTGTISTAIVGMLVKSQNIELYVVNRGHRSVPAGAHPLICDANDVDAMQKLIGDAVFDTVIDFVVYTPQQAKDRVYLFQNHTRQYIFISTVVVFNHENNFILNEDSTQKNRFSKYGRDKAACEDVFNQAMKKGFPVTIVRPSQTYGYDRFPLSAKGKNCWSVVSRILNDKPVIIHGDGQSIWHMMHTFDFAYNFIQLIGNMNAINRSVNLVNPDIVTWNMIYDALGKALNRKVQKVHISSELLAMSSKYPLNDQIVGDKQFSNLYTDIVRDALIPDFKCMIDLQKGIELYTQYIWEHAEARVEDPEFDAWCDQVIADYHAYMGRFHAKF